MATTAATDRLLGDPVDFQGLFKVNVLLDCFDQQGPPFVLRTVRNATISGTLVITLNNLSAERDAISIVSFDLVGTLAAAWHDGSGAKSHNRTVATAPITLTPVNPDDPDTSVRRYRWRLKLLDAGSLCPSFSSKLATLAYEVRLVMLYNAVRKMRITSSKTWPVTLTESPYLVRTRIFTGIPSVLISTANKFDDVNQPMSLSPVSTNDASTTSSSSSSAPESPRSPTSPTLSFGSRRTSFLRLPDAALPTPPQSIAGSPPDSRRKSFVLSFKRSSANVSPKTSAGPPKRIPSSFLLKHRGIVAGYQIEGTLSWWYPSSHPTATPRLLDVALLCTIRISGVVSQRFVVGNDFKIEFTPEFKSRTSQRVGMIVPMDSVPSINHPLVHVSYDLSCKIYLDGAVKSSARILVPVQVLPRAKGARFGITSTPRSDSIRTATAQVEGEPTFNPDDPTGGERVETDDQAPNGDNISDQQPDGQLFEVMYPYIPTRNDELKISTGDKIIVTEQSFDGYSYARIHTRRKVIVNPAEEDNQEWGWCPQHHLSPLVESGEVEKQFVSTDFEGGDVLDGVAVTLALEKPLPKIYTCAICLCDYGERDGVVVIDVCEHAYDQECLYQTAMVCISNSEIPIPCPTCKAEKSLQAAISRNANDTIVAENATDAVNETAADTVNEHGTDAASENDYNTVNPADLVDERSENTIEEPETNKGDNQEVTSPVDENADSAVTDDPTNATTEVGTERIAKVSAAKIRGFIFDHQLARVFSDEDWSKYHRASVRAAIGGDEDYVACPRTDCPGEFLVLKGLNDEKSPFLQCPECKLKWCRECGTHVWHKNQTCAEYAAEYAASMVRKEKSERQAELDMASFLELNRRFAKCPSCNTPIEKTDGCNHMTCRRCGCSFCLLCRKRMDSSHYDDQYNYPACYDKQYADVQSEYLQRR